MFYFSVKHGYTACFYFISLVVIGVIIFLNLFLAILLANFTAIDHVADEENKISAGQALVASVTSKT